MLREQKDLLQGLHQALDLLVIAIAYYLAYVTKLLLPYDLRGLAPGYNYTLFLLLALIACHFSLRFFNAYKPFRVQTLKQIIITVFKASVFGTASVVLICYLLHMDSISRLLFGFFNIYLIILLIISKTITYRVLTYNRLRDYNVRYILLIGSRQRAKDFLKILHDRHESGYRIIDCLETLENNHTIGDTVYKSVRVTGTLLDFKSILEEKTVDEVVFGMPLKKIDNPHEYIYLAETMGINVRILPDFQIHKIKYFPKTASVQMKDFLGAPTLMLSSTPERGNTELFIKAVMDYGLSGTAIVLLAPVVFVIGVMIKLTSKGPVFFSQERVGQYGRRFKILKFRTMVVNAEELKEQLVVQNEMDGPVFKMKRDPRVTWVGSFLRKTSLDELPQLINVVKGEMSLVGPRPPVPAEVKRYKLWQHRRLSMKPGLTCIWQVSGRNSVSFDEWMRMDLEYIDNWSLSLDFKILLKTVREVTVLNGQ